MTGAQTYAANLAGLSDADLYALAARNLRYFDDCERRGVYPSVVVLALDDLVIAELRRRGSEEGAER